MNIVSMKLPIIFGIVDAILELAYAFSFHHKENSNIDNWLFDLYKGSWIIFNFLTAPVMIKYKFYFLSTYFITYALIETSLIIGYGFTGLYFKIE
jgi:hypothetical protein